LCGVARSYYWLPLNHERVLNVLKAPDLAWAFLNRHHGMSLFALPSALLNASVAQMPVLILGQRFGAEAAGHFMLAQRFLAAPAALIGKSVLDIYRVNASQAYRATGRTDEVFLSTFRLLATLALVGGAAVFFAAPLFFRIVFGAEWEVSGQMAIWLLPQICLGFVVAPLSYTYYIYAKQHWDLIWQSCLALTIFSALSYPVSLSSSVQTAALAYGLFYLVYGSLAYRLSKGIR
jgi:O-antigen/teichoic acid export membrane protein